MLLEILKVQLNALKTALKMNQEKMQVNRKEIKIHHTLLDAMIKCKSKLIKLSKIRKNFSRTLYIS